MKYIILLLLFSLFPTVIFVNRALSIHHNIFTMFETNPPIYDPKLYVIPNDFICKIYKIKKTSIPIYFYFWLWYIVIHIVSGLKLSLIFIILYLIQGECKLVFQIFCYILFLGCGLANVLFFAFWTTDLVLTRFRESKIKTNKKKISQKRLETDLSMIESIFFIFNLMIKKNPMKKRQLKKKKRRQNKPEEDQSGDGSMIDG